jgi:GNAT superfamily N-acetyltransferase
MQAPDRLALADLVHETVIAANLAIAAEVPGSLAEVDRGVVLVATGLPIRLLNQALVREGADPGAIEAAVASLRGIGVRFVVCLRAGTDDAFVDVVTGLGLERTSSDPWLPGMALHPLPGPGGIAAPTGIEIREVHGAAGVADHVSAAAAGFGMDREIVGAFVTEAAAARPDIALYAAYDGPVPVAAGLGMRVGRTIGVFNIATVDAYRGRGIGAAMTMRVVDDGAAAGCDTAILQASPMGLPIYERLGFVTVVAYDGYIERGSEGSAD